MQPRLATSILSVPKEEAHLWAIPIPPAPPEDLPDILSPEECARMVRFLSPRKQVEFGSTRYALRHILARYLALAPQDVPISLGQHGKPQLSPPVLAQHGLHFNLSHCARLALCLLARDRQVGVDVEVMKPERPMDALARRFFAPAEAETLAALPPEWYTRGFYRCWTAKEAYVKALGKGLHLPLDSFSVDADPRRPLRLLNGAHQDENGVFLEAPVEEGLCATCVLCGGAPISLRRYTFTWT
jgi:4'-phosphopantetheinyl transferase